MNFTIAIDGPAAAGRSTISKAVAERFGFAHLDTGLLYRAVGAIAEEKRRDSVEVARRLEPSALSRPNLRTGDGCGVPGGGAAASPLNHRITMSFRRSGIAAQEPVGVDDGSLIDTSFPVFERLVSELGLELAEH